MRAGPSPGNDDKVSILLPYNGKIWAAIKFGETVRIGYVYIWRFEILAKSYCVTTRAHAYITHCETVGYYNYYIIGEFEIWR